MIERWTRTMPLHPVASDHFPEPWNKGIWKELCFRVSQQEARRRWGYMWSNPKPLAHRRSISRRESTEGLETTSSLQKEDKNSLPYAECLKNRQISPKRRGEGFSTQNCGAKVAAVHSWVCVCVCVIGKNQRGRQDW